jgi:hypothetical protein
VATSGAGHRCVPSAAQKRQDGKDTAVLIR